MKTLLLTGASGDIGQAISKKFSAEQYQLIAPSHQQMNLDNNQSIIDYLSNDLPVINVFIHCAGINEPKFIDKIEEKDLSVTMQINALSFYTISHFLITNNKLIEGSYILGVSSIYGFLARPGRFCYSASKYCLKGMVKTLALELGEYNIKANTIAPGFVDTKLTRKNNTEEKILALKQKIPLRRLATPEDIAEVAYFLCSEKNRFITGQEIVIDGGYSIGGFEQ